MSVFEKHRDTLEHHETMMGSSRGRLAVALDLLTDSLALVGQHGVYCRSERFPGRPRMDIALVIEQLDDVKQLVQSAMQELKPRGVKLLGATGFGLRGLPSYDFSALLGGQTVASSDFDVNVRTSSASETGSAARSRPAP